MILPSFSYLVSYVAFVDSKGDVMKIGVIQGIVITNVYSLLSGETLVKALENGVSKFPKHEGRFLQVRCLILTDFLFFAYFCGIESLCILIL